MELIQLDNIISNLHDLVPAISKLEGVGDVFPTSNNNK